MIPRLRSPRLLVALSIGVLGVALIAFGWRTIRSPYPDLKVAAYAASKAYIAKASRPGEQLTFAALGLDPAATVRERHDGGFEVTGWAEEINMHGRPVEREWRCVLHYTGGNTWQATYLQLGGFTVGTYTAD